VGFILNLNRLPCIKSINATTTRHYALATAQNPYTYCTGETARSAPFRHTVSHSELHGTRICLFQVHSGLGEARFLSIMHTFMLDGSDPLMSRHAVNEQLAWEDMAVAPGESRVTRNLPRKDYLALNNGLDRLISPSSLDLEQSAVSDTTGYDDCEGLLPSESVSQVSSGCSSVLTSEPEELGLSAGPSAVESAAKKRKIHTSWTQDHFWITELEAQWSKRGRLPQNDRLLVCKRCSWSSSDSSRHGTTSNLLTHLRTRHRIGPQSASIDGPARGPLDRMLCARQGGNSLEQALVRWIVQTRQPFTTVEHSSFKAIFDAVAVEVPLRCADTLRDRVKHEFEDYRQGLRRELAQTCDSIAIALDTWTSEHQLSILAVIGHWITPSFERREVLLDFVELPGPHSGENMAAVVLAMLHELDIAPKLLTSPVTMPVIMEPCAIRSMRSSRRSTMTRMGIFACGR
jgi:hypothetical protein